MAGHDRARLTSCVRGAHSQTRRGHAARPGGRQADSERFCRPDCRPRARVLPYSAFELELPACVVQHDLAGRRRAEARGLCTLNILKHGDTRNAARSFDSRGFFPFPGRIRRLEEQHPRREPASRPLQDIVQFLKAGAACTNSAGAQTSPSRAPGNLFDEPGPRPVGGRSRRHAGCRFIRPAVRQAGAYGTCPDQYRQDSNWSAATERRSLLPRGGAVSGGLAFCMAGRLLPWSHESHLSLIVGLISRILRAAVHSSGGSSGVDNPGILGSGPSLGAPEPAVRGAARPVPSAFNLSQKKATRAEPDHCERKLSCARIAPIPPGTKCTRRDEAFSPRDETHAHCFSL